MSEVLNTSREFYSAVFEEKSTGAYVEKEVSAFSEKIGILGKKLRCVLI